MKADACSVFTEDSDNPGRIYLRATSNEDLQTTINSAYYDLGEGFTGWVYKHGRTFNIGDVHDKRFLAHVEPPIKWSHKHHDISPEAINSFIGVPIFSDARCVGVIRAVRKRMGAFPELEKDIFEALASTVGVIVHHNHRHKAVLDLAKADLKLLAMPVNILAA